jgi:surface-anchored protein
MMPKLQRLLGWRDWLASSNARPLPKRYRCTLETLEDRSVPSCSFPNVWTVGHVDGFDIGYTSGNWDLRTHNVDIDTYAPADQALLVAVPESKVARPTGSQWDFLGVPEGNDVWILPQTQQSNLLFLGNSSETIPPGTFASYVESDPRLPPVAAPWIKLSLEAVRGPGHFSVWNNDSFGNPIVWAASSDGITGGDSLFIVSGSHVHFNWGFSARGQYEVDIRASAFLGPGMTNPVQSSVVTYYLSAEQPGCLEFSAATASIDESAGTATITVTRSNGTDGIVTVNFATSDGSATGDEDYQPMAGTLTFADGEASTTFTIPIIDDAFAEGNETFDITLSAPTNGANLGMQTTMVLTVLDNDPGSFRILDNGEPGTGVTAGWTYLDNAQFGSFQGVQGDVHFVASQTDLGGQLETATWTFPDLAPGQYQISTTWFPHPNRATNAPYILWDGSTTLATVPVNQELTPDDFIDAGDGWRILGTFTIDSGTLTVELTNDADEYIIADSVRIERVGFTGRILDNGDSGYDVTPGWTYLDDAQFGSFQGIEGDVHFIGLGTGSEVATWTFSALPPGQYRVSATWTPHANRATDAPFTILDGAAELGTVPVNQEEAPNGLFDAGDRWEDLGVFTINSGTLVVRLSDAANEFVIADAIRIEQL